MSRPLQSPPSAMQSESGPAPRHRRSPRGVDARRPSRGSARRGYGIRAPGTEREPGTASSAAPGPAQHQVSAARWIASRKLPKRRRIVFSDGRIAASVQLSAVGSEPRSATNARRAATDSSIRVSAMSDSGTASPSNTPDGFALWELRSTTTISSICRAEFERDRIRSLCPLYPQVGRGDAASGASSRMGARSLRPDLERLPRHSVIDGGTEWPRRRRLQLRFLVISTPRSHPSFIPWDQLPTCLQHGRHR